MPSAASPVNLRSRALRALAVAIAAIAISFAFTVAAPQRAYAYSTTAMKGAVGKVTGKQHNNTYYGSSVEDVMAAVDHMTSFWNFTSHEDELTIELFCDWNTKSYGRIKVPNGYTYHIKLHGHMINRGKALSYGDNYWYAEGSGDVIFVDGGTLYLDGGNAKESGYQHAGSYVGGEYFWQYTGAGRTPSMYGGLITGGACDDWHGAGGISLARDTSRAFITNTTIAGNLTDQYDGRYGHGGGIAVHGSKCTLELDNVRVISNHAEGYGGGVYVRNSDCQLNFKNCTFQHNYSSKGGGAVYLDSKATLNIENGNFSANTTNEDGAAIYVNAKGSTLNIKGTGESYVEFSENAAKKDGAVIYTDGTDTTVNVERAHMLRNKAGADYGSSANRSGGVFYIGDNRSTLNITDCVMEYNGAVHGTGGVVYFYGNDSNLNITGSTFNNNTASVTSDGGKGRGAVIYHAGRRGKVTIKNSKMTYNEADNHGGVVYNEYSGTEFEVVGSTIEGNKASTDGAAFYFQDTATLTLDNTTVTGNTASACGGGVYVAKTAGSSKIYLKNNASICKNTAATNCSGGGVYADNTLTVSSDGTGTITGNKAAKNGGGIWFSGSLYLDNVSIIDNTAGNIGGGVYCDNTASKTFEVANKVTIWGNKGSNNSDSNLYLRKSQTLCSADGDRKLSTESKIGVEAEDATSTGVRRVAGNQLVMQALGEKYSTVFYSDNADCTITANDGYVNLDPDTSGKLMVTVKIGSYKKNVAPTGDSSTVELNTSEILNFDEKSYNSESFLNRSTYSTIDYYTVTDGVGERRIEVKDGKATVELRGSQATAVPHVVRTVGSFGIQVQDAATWSELPSAGSNKVSIKLLNFRERVWTLYYQHHSDWIKDHSDTHEVEYSDGAGYDHWTETEYDWWDNDPTKGTELLPKVDTYGYSFDNILSGSDAATAATVTRTKVEDVSGGRKVTYQVTIKKDTLYAKDLMATSSDGYGLLQFEGNAVGTDENGLGSQTVSDQSDERTDPTYKTKACTTSVDAEGNQVVTFTVTYPKTRAVVTFDATEGTLPDGASSTTVTVNASKTLPSMPKPTREGYVFDGWYNGDAKVTSTTEFTNDTTVTAHWTAQSSADAAKYRMVLYMSQEGSSASDLSTVDIDLARFLDGATETSIDAPAQPSREGYTFGGWYKDAACSEDQKFDFSTDKVSYSETDEDFQLFAKWTANTYTVTLKDAYGGARYEYDVSYGSHRTYEDLLKSGIVRNPTREAWEGLEFAGWVLDGQLYDFNAPVTGNITLTPSWRDKTHTVTYDTSDGEDEDEASGQAALVSLMALAADSGTAAQDGSSDTGKTTAQVANGGTAPEFEPTRAGYRFAGWYIDKGRTEAYDFTKTVTGDFTLYAKWVKTATITFETGDGAEAVASLTVDAGTTVKSSDLPLAVRENYRFHGWLTGSAEDGTAVADKFTVDGDTTLYAHWVGDTVFVFLHGIYGEDEIYYDMRNYGDVLEGIQVNVDHADPVREGYTFGGWYTDEDCTEEYEFDKDALTADLDLYAKWTPESCNVKFVDSIDGSELGGEVVAGGEVAGEPEAPTRSGYVLKGWFTDASCTEVWDFSEPVTKSMTLYAGWAEAVTVTFNTNGGELPEGAASLAVEKGAPVGSLPVPRRGVTGTDTASADDGYVFAGWYTAEGQKVDADTKFDSDVTLTAYWVRNGEVCFVTYYSAGEMLDYDVVKTGDKLTRPADPVRAGYEFTGWYTDEACTKAYDFDSAVTADMNLYAGWKATDGGSGSDTDTDGSGKKGNLPRTGDDSGVAVVAVLVAGVILVLVGVIVKRRQR